jgi:hypothetical protein
VTEPAIPAFTAVGQVPLVAGQGPWSVSVLAAEDPVSRKMAAVSGGVVLLVVVSLTVASWRRGRALADAWRERRHTFVALMGTCCASLAVTAHDTRRLFDRDARSRHRSAAAHALTALPGAFGTRLRAVGHECRSAGGSCPM